MAFSSTDAGLEGFRLTRENPRAYLRWAFFSFVVSVLGAFVTVNMPPEIRNALQVLGAEETPDATTLGRALLAASPLLVIGLLIQCMMTAAVYRIIFRHDDTRFGYLRMGADELRLVALTLIYFVMAVVFLALVILVAGLIAAAASVAGGGVAVFVAAAAELAVFALAIYVAVRLSLAPVITFAERRLAVFDSWAVTRGHFWRLFGAYVLALACIVAVALLALVIFSMLAGVAILLTGGELADLGAVFSPDETTLTSYLNPFMIAYMVVGSFLTALYYAVVAAPGAVAYRELHGAPPAAKG
ncbi:hypothetical protein [Phenylobacterium sp.]|jgi:hypothetical protein|uniref:hypothetical protein n=1 Tax=Phenylobacterium sp. TaxID=1871053 RepID=UPI002F922F7C